MNLPCLHAYRLPLLIHAGGCMTGSFEGRPLDIDCEICVTCGEIRLKVRHALLFAAYLKERTQDRRQT